MHWIFKISRWVFFDQFIGPFPFPMFVWLEMFNTRSVILFPSCICLFSPYALVAAFSIYVVNFLLYVPSPSLSILRIHISIMDVANNKHTYTRSKNKAPIKTGTPKTAHALNSIALCQTISWNWKKMNLRYNRIYR